MDSWMQASICILENGLVIFASTIPTFHQEGFVPSLGFFFLIKNLK